MSDRDKIAEIIREARINASPMAQLGYPEADALIKHGAILPPCKVGDMVYTVVGEVIGKDVVRRIVVDEFGMTICIGYFCKTIDEIGKTVFLTQEEAEKKLEEMGK